MERSPQVCKRALSSWESGEIMGLSVIITASTGRQKTLKALRVLQCRLLNNVFQKGEILQPI